MFTIFKFSSERDTVSTRRSDGIIIRTCEFFMGRQLNDKERKMCVEKYVVYVRKAAHFTLYFILGLAYISLLKEFNLDDKKLLIYTIIFVFIYACSDEFHQLFVPGRSGEFMDVIIDTTGGVFASFIYTVFKVRRRLHG